MGGSIGSAEATLPIYVSKREARGSSCQEDQFLQIAERRGIIVSGWRKCAAWVVPRSAGKPAADGSRRPPFVLDALEGSDRQQMETRELLDALGYSGSPNCLTGHALEFAPDYGHVFRRATEGAGLQAVYCLRPPTYDATAHEVVPVSYVCKADSYERADENTMLHYWPK